MYYLEKASVIENHEVGSVNSRNLFSHVLEAVYQKSTSWQVFFLLRPLSLAYRWLSSFLSPGVIFYVCDSFYLLTKIPVRLD